MKRKSICLKGVSGTFATGKSIYVIFAFLRPKGWWVTGFQHEGVRDRGVAEGQSDEFKKSRLGA